MRRLEGWTLVEVLLSMAIVFTLTGTVGYIGAGQVERSRHIAAETQIRTLEIALESYAMDCGTYPTAAQGLQALVEPPVLMPVPQGWRGPYLRRSVPRDPWGELYHYEVPGPGGLPYRITHSRSAEER